MEREVERGSSDTWMSSGRDEARSRGSDKKMKIGIFSRRGKSFPSRFSRGGAPDEPSTLSVYKTLSVMDEGQAIRT